MKKLIIALLFIFIGINSYSQNEQWENLKEIGFYFEEKLWKKYEVFFYPKNNIDFTEDFTIIYDADMIRFVVNKESIIDDFKKYGLKIKEPTIDPSNGNTIISTRYAVFVYDYKLEIVDFKNSDLASQNFKVDFNILINPDAYQKNKSKKVMTSWTMLKTSDNLMKALKHESIVK